MTRFSIESGTSRGAPVSSSPAARLAALGGAVLDLVFPSPCLACGALEPTSTEGWRTGPAQRIGLCGRCRQKLLPQPRAACVACARPLTGAALPAGYRCPACRKRPPAHEMLLVPWVYRPPIDSVILALKFRGLRYLARGLAEGIARRVAAEAPAVDLVVAVPLHWHRRLGRGYNQAEELASAVASRLGLPTARVLRRRRATRPQMSLALTERRANLRGAFAARRGAERVRGRRVLLVDDVVTSGATLGEAAARLRRSGASAVYAAAVARAAEPGDGWERERESPRGALSGPFPGGY